MKVKYSLAIAFVVLSSINLFSQVPNNELFGLAKIQQSTIKSKRVSSYDRSGNNNDRLTFIKDGEKATLFDVKGAGVINHIWITIAPLQPNINRNDIILRMYHLADPVYFNQSLKFSIEHGHANSLTLDLATVAYWYQSEASPLPWVISKEDRQPMPPIGPSELFKWRQEWRISKGNQPDLWGNE